MFTELDQLIPRQQYAHYLEGRALDYLQPLVDLGFLRLSQTEDLAAVQRALQEFRVAYRELSWLSEDHFNPATSALPPAHEPDSLEIKLLHLLVNMDGDFQLTKLPVSGDLNIFSRVIFYRLRLHGFWKPGDSPQRYQPEILRTVITKLNNWIPINFSVLEWVNLLGNIPELIRRTFEKGGLDRQIVCFKYAPRTALTKEVRDEVIRESEEEVAAETREIQSVDLEIIRPKSDQTTAVTNDSSVVGTTRRNRRIQSNVERLREKINDTVDKLRETLDERHIVHNRLEPDIVSEKEKLEILQNELALLKEEKKQLGGQNKSLKKLKEDYESATKKLAKKKEKLAGDFSEHSNLDTAKILALFQDKLQKLKHTQLNDPDHKRRKVKRSIRRIERKITLVENYLANAKVLEGKRLRIIKRDAIEQKIAARTNEIIRTDNKLAALLGAQQKLVSEFDDSLGDNQKKLRVLVDKYQPLLKKLEKIPRRFRRELKEYLAPQFYDIVRKELLDGKNATLFQETLHNPYNQFLVRLLQLHQWTNGYYNGLIDNDLGGRTFKSICEIEKDIKSMKLRFVLYQLNAATGTWLLNIRYLFAEMIDSLDAFREQANFETVAAKYQSEIVNNPAIINQQKRLDQILDDTNKEISQSRKNNKMRRVYFGVGTLAVSVVRGIGRLVRLLVKGVKFLYRLLKNFVLLLYREIREGLRKFGQGIAFLFGKRQITSSFTDGNPAIVTRFDFDCDVQSFASTGSGAHIAAHRTSCYHLTHNLEFALRLTAKVIEWTLRAVRLNWMTIFIKIALYFKKQIKAFLKRKVLSGSILPFPSPN